MSKKTLTCNRPIKSWKPEKKKVVKACSRDMKKIIHFGATGYGNNYSISARKSFRARHKCNSAKDKLTARYWACQNLWIKGGDTRKCPSNRVCKYDTRSPRKRTRSPRKRLKSPTKRTRSPRKRTRSPRKRSRQKYNTSKTNH